MAHGPLREEQVSSQPDTPRRITHVDRSVCSQIPTFAPALVRCKNLVDSVSGTALEGLDQLAGRVAHERVPEPLTPRGFGTALS